MYGLPTRYELLGEEASSAFLNYGDGLSQAVAKIASREGLNPFQIDRVVQATNQATLAHYRKSATEPDHTYEFKLASSDDVKNILHPAVELDSGFVDRDVRLPPVTKAASAPPEDRDPLPYERTTEEQVARIADLGRQLHSLDKEAAAAHAYEMERGVWHFVKIAQQMVAQEGWTYGALEEALHSARPKQANLSSRLVRLARTYDNPIQAHRKEASPAPEHLFRKTLSQSGMPVQVTNGSHAIILTLDTLVAQDFDPNAPTFVADDTKRAVVTALRNVKGRVTPMTP